jgi:hypothetical protein
MALLLVEVNVRYDGCAHNVLAFINQGLPQELLNILKVLLVNDFGQNPQSICLEHIIIGQLNVLSQATNDDEHFVFTDIQLLDEHVDQSPQVLVQLVSLRLWNLK